MFNLDTLTSSLYLAVTKLDVQYRFLPPRLAVVPLLSLSSELVDQDVHLDLLSRPYNFQDIPLVLIYATRDGVDSPIQSD